MTLDPNRPPLFDPRITWGNIIIIVGIVASTAVTWGVFQTQVNSNTAGIAAARNDMAKLEERTRSLESNITRTEVKMDAISASLIEVKSAVREQNELLRKSLDQPH